MTTVSVAEGEPDRREGPVEGDPGDDAGQGDGQDHEER